MSREAYQMILNVLVTVGVSLYRYCVLHSPLWKVRFFS